MGIADMLTSPAGSPALFPTVISKLAGEQAREGAVAPFLLMLVRLPSWRQVSSTIRVAAPAPCIAAAFVDVA